MKLAVPLKQFRTDLERYLKLIDTGAEIEITKYDKPFVSVVSPTKGKSKTSPKQAVKELFDYLDTHDFSGNFPKGLSAKQLLAQARTEDYKR